MAEGRTQHPFHMYDEIVGQPKAVREVLAARAVDVRRLATRLRARPARRLILAGTGTSYHAAACAAWCARLAATPLPALALPAFDLASYPLALGRDDAVVVISHRGTKRYTGVALEVARASGALAVLVTGQGEHQAPAGVTDLRTCPQDRSSAHTVSYTSALTVLALLLAEYAEDGQMRDAVLALPEQLQAALQGENEMRRLAGRFADHERIYFAGGGPHAVTAAEAALKVKETSYIVSEGFAIEQMLHGPMQAVTGGDVVVAIVPGGPTAARAADLLHAAGEIGAARVAIVSEGCAELPAEEHVVVPRVSEALSPIVTVVALQLFAYHSALARGRNPDCFRLDDERYRRAAGRFQL